ncbi:MAG: hypothetical protein AB1757_27995 [Acidobacteriota bacterium]
MTSEELEKAIQFVLEQQGQFYAGLKELEAKQHQQAELQGQQHKQFEQQQKQLDQLTNSVMGLTAIAGTLAEKYTELIEAQKKLTESQEHTDKRLHAVIDILMKRNPINGNSQ